MAWTQNYALASIRGMMPRPYLLELWQATEERRIAAAAAAPAGFAASVEVNGGGYMPAWTAGTAMPSEGWFQAIDSVIDGMFGNFANQYDEANWDGDTAVPPRWDEASMLTQIGAGSRIRMAAGKMLSAEWIRQVYLILDELRWVSVSYVENSASRWSAGPTNQIGNSGNQASWAAAMTAADAAWPTASGSGSDPLQYTYGTYDGANYLAEKVAQKGTFTPSKTLDYAADVDLYWYVLAETGVVGIASPVYSAQTTGYAEDRYNRIYRATHAVTGSPLSLTVGTHDEPTDWTADPVGGDTTKGWRAPKSGAPLGQLKGAIVYKHDVVNGFDKVT